MIVIPIRTESAVHRPPAVNYILIGVNFLCFFAFSQQFGGAAVEEFKARYLSLHAQSPSFYTFLTYQFMHATPMHILGNMLFLWVFGNSVNSKMGNGPYLMFYLAGGIFAGWGWAMVDTDASILVGASGSIAAVTTAYLALFPRSHVTVLVWLFIFIHFFEWPAMILILLKIIVWDNIVGPALMGAGNIAHSAHLAGYFFGFVAGMIMLLARAVQRDQFDMLALWSRWKRRREFASAMAGPGDAGPARYATIARQSPADEAARRAEDQRLDELADRRAEITALIEDGSTKKAADAYLRLLEIDERQCLSERSQLAIGRLLYADGRFGDAAQAFERFVECYPRSLEALDVRLLLGIVLARDLNRMEQADRHLTVVWDSVADAKRRAQCAEWLTRVRASLGRPAPQEAQSTPGATAP